MKRKSLLIILAILVAATAACTAMFLSLQPTMVLQPAQFSAETQAAMDALGSNYCFFDYSVDTSVSGMKVELWRYDGSEWNAATVAHGDVSKGQHRFGVLLDKNGIEVVFMEDDGITRISSDRLHLPSGTGRSTARLSGPVSIVPDQELALYLILASDGAMVSGSLESFRDSECQEGLALVVTFTSDKL